MSKHINFVCSDSVYSGIKEFMKVRNIKNLSWAIRILLIDGLESLVDEEPISVPNFSEYIDCLSSEEKSSSKNLSNNVDK